MGELNFKRFLQFKTLKLVFATRKTLMNLNDQDIRCNKK